MIEGGGIPAPVEVKAASQSLLVTPEAPAALASRGGGRWFADFGRAMFGTLRLTVRAAAAGTAEVCLGEKLAPDGAIDRAPPGCIRCRVVALALRPGVNTCRVVIPPDARNTGSMAVRMPASLFEVTPFRYAEITLAAGDSLEAVARLAVHAPFNDAASTFACSDERLTRVWDLCKHSIKATSFLGLYVDGDRERIAYEADAYLNQLSHYGVDCAYDIARRTFEHLLDHPTWPTEWALHFAPMAWADYAYTGEAGWLARHVDALRERLLLPLARADGLISTETGLQTPGLLARLNLDKPMRDIVDWPPGSFTQGGTGERDGYEMRPVNTVVNAFHGWNLRLFAQIARTLGRDEEAACVARRASRVASAMRRKLFDPSRGVFRDGEGTDHAALHATAFPAAFGLLPRSARATAAAFIRSRGMACSVYGAQYLLEACYRLGLADHALDLMTAGHDRGWLNMLRAGSTVTLEAWDWRYKNNLDWNHAWGAAPANIIPRFLVGVRPELPGFAVARVAPQPAGLKAFDATVPTCRGPVRVVFEGGGRRRRLTVDAPMPFRLDLSGIAGAPLRTRLCRAGVVRIEQVCVSC